VKSPNNQTLLPGEAATLPNSRGFEGMAVTRNGRRLRHARPGRIVAERVIGHELPELIAVYDVHAYETEKRAALNKWAGELRRILKIFPRVERECSL
jgi:hypothetical protein